MATEDAAVLANLLSSTLQEAGSSAPSASDIELMLQEFTVNRQKRTRAICDHSEFLVRMQANDGFFKRVLARYLVPLLKDVPAGLSSSTLQGAPKLNFLNLGERASADGWHGSFRASFRNLRFFLPTINLCCIFSALAVLVMAGFVLQQDI